MIHVGGQGDWKVIENLLKDIKIPRMAKVRQIFPHPPAVDVEAEIRRQLAEKKLLPPLKKGSSIAIAVGSRGIANLPLAVRVLGEEVRAVGGEPFIVPAMGSHAGATAEGQAAMLRGMGYTEENVGMPIRSCMDTVELGKTESGMPVLIDRLAYEADGIIITNRVKPHVCFRGPYESGLMKMITIGLGKQRGADIAHNLGFGKMPEHVPEIARESLKKIKLLFALGLVENAFHETCTALLLAPGQIETEEPKLLNSARDICPKLYFETLDALILDEVGKEISGSGFDTNVVGRYHSAWISGGPKITRLVILDISAKSKGNGNGLGMADFTTRRAAEKFDFTQTYPNTLTATLTGGVKIPMTLPNDRQAIQSCIKTSNLMDWSAARIVRIHNTLCLTEIEV
ncbi:MAG: nickel-dependent lactate racemase, partial [Spirochaetales bacterium]|nr:nickel-dependent lactate racemase [Spirochaetales bacterium]